MINKKIAYFVHSFILLPIISVSGGLGAALPNAGSSLISTSQFVLNEDAPVSSIFSNVKDVEEQAALVLKTRAQAIDAYFKERNMPLAGKGEKMVVEAEKNGLDWRLVAAIAVRESTGGRHACQRVPNNPFGWGSCRIGFESNDHAIEVIAKNLGGNNPKTAYHYENKDVKGILQAYNPPSIVPKYAEQVISIMDTIGDVEAGVEITKK
jgi:hypothetical protein